MSNAADDDGDEFADDEDGDGDDYTDDREFSCFRAVLVRPLMYLLEPAPPRSLSGTILS